MASSDWGGHCRRNKSPETKSTLKKEEKKVEVPSLSRLDLIEAFGGMNGRMEERKMEIKCRGGERRGTEIIKEERSIGEKIWIKGNPQFQRQKLEIRLRTVQKSETQCMNTTEHSHKSSGTTAKFKCALAKSNGSVY